MRDAMDKVKSGEIPLGSTEVETARTDEGGISSTKRRKVWPLAMMGGTATARETMCATATTLLIKAKLYSSWKEESPSSSS